jgi:hypothetical protein
MAGTVSLGSIYPGSSATTQQTRNVGGSAKVPTRTDFQVPILSDVSSFTGMSIPILIALGVLAWFLIERYN